MIIGLNNCAFKSLIAWSHITLSVIMLLSIVLFMVFGSDYRFFIDWITHNPFRCMAWKEADTKISGRLSSSKTHPHLLERYCALFMYLQVDCMYMSVCAVLAEVPEKAFFMLNDLWIRLENQHDWKLEKQTFWYFPWL